MKANEIKTAAMNVISENSCYTCKDVKNVYPALVDDYGKDNAKSIVKKACEMLKAHAVTTKANATKVIDGLQDGDRVLRSAWNSILKDRSINQFAVIVYNNCDKDLVKMINKYASLKDSDGIAAIRHYSKKLDLVYYTRFDLEHSTVSQAMSIAKQAIRNAKTAAIKGAYKYSIVNISK